MSNGNVKVFLLIDILHIKLNEFNSMSLFCLPEDGSMSSMKIRTYQWIRKSLEPTHRAVFSPNFSQSSCDLPQREVALHTFNQQWHQIVWAIRRILQLGYQLIDFLLISHLTQFRQAIFLSFFQGRVHSKQVQGQFFIHLIDIHTNLMGFSALQVLELTVR